MGRKLTCEEVKSYIESFGYELLSKDYIGKDKKLLVMCNHKHEPYEVTFNNFRKGRRCPYCNISKGEQRIMDFLEKKGVEYIYDKSYFNDLLSPLGNPLRPDFILPDYKIWIEYDGEFHYENEMDENCYKTLQIHDEIKNIYAKENGWRLIRIPYWDFDNIEQILNKELKGD